MQAKHLLLVVTLVSLLALPLVANLDVEAQKRTEFQLSFTPMAPILPADGGKYPAIIQLQTLDEKPAPAPHDLEIDLLSSDPTIISLPQKGVIKEGQTYVKVDLVTTQKAGRVIVSSLGAGAEAGMATLDLVRPEGLDPTQLALYSSTPEVVPDPRFPTKLYVQLLNPQKLPAHAKIPIKVTLSSEDTDVGEVPNEVTIPTGGSGVFVDFTPGIISGETQVTASASGLTPGSVEVMTVDVVGEDIILEIAPDKIPASKGAESIATVQLVDSSGFPVKPSQSITVFLVSSNDTIVSVPETVVISPGESYETIEITAQGDEGDATVTASAEGYESGFANVEAMKPGSEGTQIALFASPSILPPDNHGHQAIVIQYQDDNNAPYIPRRGEPDVLLTSSDIQVGTVEDTVEFAESRHYALAIFTTEFVVGDATITASQTGYRSAQVEIEVDGPEARELAIAQIPSIMEADGLDHDAIVVRLNDESKEPVPAPRDTRVELRSSDTDIVIVDPVLTIPEGQSYAIAHVKTTTEEGSSVITASSQGLSQASVTFKTTGSLSLHKLEIYTMPEVLPADGDTYGSIVVQVQDLRGNPTAALSDIVVALSSSSLVGGSVDRSLIIPAGSTYAIANYTTSTTEDQIEVTASAQGFESVLANMDTSLQRMTINTSAVPRRSEFNDIPIEVEVLFGDLPLKGAFVEVTGPNADVTSDTTDEDGMAQVSYIPTAPGTQKVIITVSKKGFDTVTKNLGLSIQERVSMTLKAETDGGRDVSTKFEVTPEVGKVMAKSTKAGKPVVLADLRSGIYTISAPEEMKKPDGVYKFTKWSDGVTDNPRVMNIGYDSNVVALYSASYLLQGSSPYGTVSGNGWYPEGSTATLSIEPTFLSEFFIIDKTFAGWSGGVNSKEPTVSVVMNSPKSVTAEWSDGYAKLIGIIGGGAGVAGFFFYKKAKLTGLRKKEKPPDLDWFKSG
ncbi:MAG: hypothetical protein ACE5KA_06370 [Nitrososphaerales archaeon]